MNKMKIAFVQPIQAPYWTERLKYLAENDALDIYLILERESFDSRPGWKPELIPGVTTIIVGSQVTRTESRNPDLGYSVKGLRTIPWRLSSVLSSIRPDVVVVCNATQLLCALPARWLRRFNLALIVEDTPHSTRNQKATQALIKKLVYRHADSWMPFNQDAGVFLQSLGINTNIYPSSWSVDLKKFTPDPKARARSGKRIISFVGAFIERKGIMPLLQAWASIPRSKRQLFELRIAGSGPLLDSMQRYIKENGLDDVVLLGQVPYEGIIDLLQSSSLLVLPTLEDVYGMVVLEAMACGCPVITTPYAGARELVDDGVTGWIADPLNNVDLHNKLSLAMSDIHRLEEMGIQARKKALLHETKNVMEVFATQLIDMSETT